MPQIKVYFESGDIISTGFNGTFTDAFLYYQNFVNVSENFQTGKETYDVAIGIEELGNPQNVGILYFNLNKISSEIAELDGLYLDYQNLKHSYPWDKDTTTKKDLFFAAKEKLEKKYHKSLRDLRLSLMPKSSQKFMSQFVHLG